ncbi:hypothetical protein JCM10908_000103 [Rhodotorula pacifica]|uniref:uncharacterized protein n=1 Tax=Rhodotorula pacifica TaxID=1495444 RepID=UPI00316B7FBA
MAASEGTDKQSHDGIDSARIGWAFLSQYYSYLNKDPARLHCFYTKRSTLLHSTEGEDATACYGQQEIHAKIMSLQFEDCKVYISNVDSQSSAEGGIIVQVIGEMSNANGPWRKFAQTFFLAGQHNGYFVLNDICRYIKEEGDEGTEAFIPARPDSPAEPSPSALPPAASVESVLFDEGSGTNHANHPQSPQGPQSTGGNEAGSQSRPDDSFTFHSDVLAPAALNGTSLASDDAPPSHVAGVQDPSPAERDADEEDLAHGDNPSSRENAIRESAITQHDEAENPSSTAKDRPSAPAVAEPSADEATADPSAAEADQQAPPSSNELPPAAKPSAVVAPSPPAPAPPKSWASLAASGSSKWGKVTSETKGVSAAIPQASASTERAAPNTNGPATAAPPNSFTEAVMAVKTPSCFVKGVVEAVTDQMLKDALTTRFGPLKELDIVRSKACAFIEFEKLDHARKAIQVSMRPSEGGEGAIFVTAEPGGVQHRINVVERKPHDQRPVSKRGGGAMGGAERGGFRASGSGRDGADNAARGGRAGGTANTRGGRGGGGSGRGGARAGGAAGGK